MASERIPLFLFLLFGSLSVFYQTVGRDLYFQTGWGNTVQPISDFPYTCRKLRDPGLEACEDMWLSEATRQLFMACSDASARKDWMPNVNLLNATGRSKRDKLIAMSIDSPKGSSFAHRDLTTIGYKGVKDDFKLYLVAVNGVDFPDGQVQLYVNNNRPSVHPQTGEISDSYNEQVGANTTIEVFSVANAAKSGTAQHRRTFVDPQIATPNRIAPTESGSFYFTNDHGTNRAGFWHRWSTWVKSGDVSFCTAAGICKRVEKGLAFPNGLLLGKKDGLLYVPSTSSATIGVYQPLADGSLKKIDLIKVGYPLDNISEDANGDYWVAGFPKFRRILGAFANPYGPNHGPSVVLRIRRRADGKGYEAQKMLEDRDGAVLPITTTAVHDAKTGRIFLSGVVSPFITVCDPK